MNGMSLDKILSDLSQATTTETKTAAAKTEPKPDTSKVAKAGDELLAVLKKAEAAAPEEKTASESASSPVADLQKVAADLAAADQEALVKEANFYGAAIADGFMSRLKQYESAAEALPSTKVASDERQKIAEEAVRGYVETRQAIKVAAERDFNQGYQDAMGEITKIANDSFAQGMQDAQATLQAAAK